MKKYLFTLLILLLLSGIGLLRAQLANPVPIDFETIMIEISGKQITLEVAATAAQRRRGLMFRTQLTSHTGMLFVYPEAGDHRIWMKNTKIPLTVVWFDSNAVVIDVKKLMPCLQVNCPSYGASSASKYIIEFNENYSDLKPGDSLAALPLLY